MSDMNAQLQVKRPEGDSPIWIGILFVIFGVLAALVIGFSVVKEGHVTQQIIARVLGSASILFIFTILYKENPLFRFVEHIYIGLAAGFGTILSWNAIMKPYWYTPYLPAGMTTDGGGQWWLLIPFLFGLLFFTVYFPRISWMNRFVVSILMGFAAGFALRAFIGLLAPQLVAAFRPVVTVYQPAGIAAGANNIPLFGLWWHPLALVAFVVMICTMAYFFFSVDHKAPWIRKPASAGRVFMMITLGAIFGTTVMGRFSLVIERFSYLISPLQPFFAPVRDLFWRIF